MDRSLAEEIANKLKALDRPLNEVAVAIEKMPDVEQKREFRRAFASVVAAIYTELQVPLGRLFPDLLPDQDDLGQT